MNQCRTTITEMLKMQFPTNYEKFAENQKPSKTPAPKFSPKYFMTCSFYWCGLKTGEVLAKWPFWALKTVRFSRVLHLAHFSGLISQEVEEVERSGVKYSVVH